MSDFAKIVGPGEFQLERVLPGPIERVWAYLTESELRGKWFASGTMDLRVGSRFDLYFHHADLSREKTPPPKYEKISDGFASPSQITQCEPPRLLAYTSTFGSQESEVVFELTPQGDDVRLVLTHRRLASTKDMMGFSSGWHSHLGILDDNLAGREPRPFWTTHAQLEKEYERRFADAKL